MDRPWKKFRMAKDASSGPVSYTHLDVYKRQARHQSQHFRNARGSRPANVVLRKDVDRGRRLPNLLGLLRGSGHLDVTELFQAQVLESCATALVDLRAIGPAGDHQTRYQEETQLFRGAF